MENPSRSRLQLRVIVLLFLIMLQYFLGDRRVFGEVTPDLVTIVFFFLTQSHGSLSGVGMGILVGGVEDLLSTAPIGYNLLIRVVSGFLFGTATNKIVIDRVLYAALLTLLAITLNEVLTFFASLFFTTSPSNLFSPALWVGAGIGVVLAPILYRGLGWIRVLGNRNAGSPI